MFGIGHNELIIVMVIVLILFGPKNLPKLANSIGRAMRDFKSGLSGVGEELDREIDEEESKAPAKAQAKPAPASLSDQLSKDQGRASADRQGEAGK